MIIKDHLIIFFCLKKIDTYILNYTFMFFRTTLLPWLWKWTIKYCVILSEIQFNISPVLVIMFINNRIDIRMSLLAGVHRVFTITCFAECRTRFNNTCLFCLLDWGGENLFLKLRGGKNCHCLKKMNTSVEVTLSLPTYDTQTDDKW